MKTRLITLCAALATAALAFGALRTVWTTEGRGTLTSGDRTGHFAVAAGKRQHNTAAAQMGGWVLLELPKTSSATALRLTINVRNYMQEGNIATLTGPAVRRVRSSSSSNGSWTEIRGEGRVIVTSNRHRGETGNPDTVSFRFTPTTGTDVFEFAGPLTSGDVTVTKTESY